MYTGSGDKTISIWDSRSGLCSQTLQGHDSPVNHITCTLQGNNFASCDAEGIVKLWDARNLHQAQTISIGPHSSNKVAFDPSGKCLAVASNGGYCHL